MSGIPRRKDTRSHLGEDDTVVDAIRTHLAGTAHLHCLLERGEGFSTYYQLGGANKSAKANAEPKKQEELKSHYEGSHSLLGVMWQVASATGWTPHFIKWGLPYAELMIMMADAPRLVNEQPQDNKPQAKSTVEIFQTMLNKQ